MIRTKHLVVIVALFLGILLGIWITVFMMKGDSSDATSQKEASFGAGADDFGVLATESANDTSARESLVSKLTDRSSVTDIERNVAPEAATEITPEETTPDDATDNADEPPIASLHIDGDIHSGTHGSYCWNQKCADIAITDLPYAPYTVAVGSPIVFSFNTAEEPDQVVYFLKNLMGTSTTLSKELTSSEVRTGTVYPDTGPGTYLLFITAVWDGMDVVTAFKIAIQ